MRQTRATLQGAQTCAIAVVALAITANLASAQNYSFDARKIALGSGGERDNITAGLIDEYRQGGSLLLPLGAIQWVRDFDRINPGSDEFDLADVFEYAANPLHYVIGRGSGVASRAFIDDLTSGRLNRDLTLYQGFVPDRGFATQGGAMPVWGKTLIVNRRASRFDGVFIGAGPYLAAGTEFSFDDRLIEVFATGRLDRRVEIEIEVGPRPRRVRHKHQRGAEAEGRGGHVAPTEPLTGKSAARQISDRRRSVTIATSGGQLMRIGT